jgi:hypothetical protein
MIFMYAQGKAADANTLLCRDKERQQTQILCYVGTRKGSRCKYFVMYGKAKAADANIVLSHLWTRKGSRCTYLLI